MRKYVTEWIAKVKLARIKPNRNKDRVDELLNKYEDDYDLLELLLLLQEENVNNKMFMEENTIDLGVRKGYDKIIHRIFKCERR